MQYRINPALINQINSDGLNPTEALIYCFVIHFGLDLTHVLSKIINEDNEAFYRINLTDRDIETGVYTLKIPLFLSEDYSDKFTDLIKLLKSKGFTSNGHPDNPVKYSVLDTSKSTKEAFNRYYTSDIDLTRLANVIVSYYRKTEMPLKLENFFDKVASIEYDSYSENDNFL